MYSELIVLISTFIVLLFLYQNSPTNYKGLENFVGPPPKFLIGNALDFGKGPEYLIGLIGDWIEQYGRRVKLFLGVQPYVIVANAEDVEKVLSSQVHIEKSSDYDFLMPWLGTGLLTSKGQKWHSRRKMLTPAFHFKILEDFLVVMNEQSDVMVQVLKKLSKENSFNVFPYITHAALDIICETAMGKKINAQLQSDSEYIKAIYRISELIQYRQFRPWFAPDFIWKLSSAGKEETHCLDILHSFTSKVIQERKEERKTRSSIIQQESNDDDESFFGKKRRQAFLDLLLDAQEKDPNGVKDLDIREETDTFMFEGHDTTAANVNWTVFLLGHNPHIQAKVQEELEQIFGDDHERPVTMEDLTRMKYLELCIKESLRIYPSVPFIGRVLNSDCSLDSSTTIPEGTSIFITTYHTHRDPKVFPDPEKFNPDRFLPENATGRHPFAYIPFSAGPRNCIGQKFALMEEKVLISSVFRNFQVKSMESREDVKLLAELILRPKDGLKIQLKSKW